MPRRATDVEFDDDRVYAEVARLAPHALVAVSDQSAAGGEAAAPGAILNPAAVAAEGGGGGGGSPRAPACAEQRVRVHRREWRAVVAIAPADLKARKCRFTEVDGLSVALLCTSV